MLLFYLQLGEVTPSSLGSLYFLVSVGRTTKRTGYVSGSKAHNNFKPTLQGQVTDVRCAEGGGTGLNGDLWVC